MSARVGLSLAPEGGKRRGGGGVRKGRFLGGKALLLASLHGLRELGYVYGIIGHAGPIEFYQKTVGAIVIPDSDPGIYANLLK